MDKLGWGNTTPNRLHINQPKIPELHSASANNNAMERKHATVQTTQCRTNEHMPKAEETLKTKKNAPATGTKIAYDIQELRNNPEKPQKYCQSYPLKEEKGTKNTEILNKQWGK